MIFTKALALKVLGGSLFLGSAAVGTWFVYDSIENKGMDEYNWGLWELAGKVGTIKASEDPTKETELKISTEPNDDTNITTISNTGQKITVTMKTKSDGNANPIFGKTWKCEINLMLPPGQTTGTLEGEEKPVEKIKKMLGVGTSDEALLDTPVSGKLKKSKVQKNIQSFIKFCANNGEWAVTGQKPSITETKGTVNLTVEQKTDEPTKYVLPANLKNLLTEGITEQ